jgi:hypothetical protein
MLEDGQRECRCLAGTRLRTAKQVSAGEQAGNGLLLDGGGLCILCNTEGVLQGLDKAEFRER